MSGSEFAYKPAWPCRRFQRCLLSPVKKGKVVKTAKLIVFCLLILFVWEVEESHSALVDRGGGLVYDNVLNVTWLQRYESIWAAELGCAVQWAQDLTFMTR